MPRPLRIEYPGAIYYVMNRGDCLMRNHFHLVIETPHPNLVVGMKWLLGVYTKR